MSKHSAGPWQVQILVPGRSALVRVADGFGARVIAALQNDGSFAADEFDDNARLIARAPEMHDALPVKP